MSAIGALEVLLTHDPFILRKEKKNIMSKLINKFLSEDIDKELISRYNVLYRHVPNLENNEMYLDLGCNVIKLKVIIQIRLCRIKLYLNGSTDIYDLPTNFHAPKEILFEKLLTINSKDEILPKIYDDPKKMSRGRAAYLRRLLPYLRNQSEDCLYLNIYAPDKDRITPARKLELSTIVEVVEFYNCYPMELASLPVMVFIHGESFSWNSGNPYDGSVIASYADVIVVTINFRLGIFGFLKQSLIPGPKSISNLGLMDQVAALKWIKDNIAKFGGDPTLVTLFGHHTGMFANTTLIQRLLCDNGKN
uniref:COesterase domain-containing protein n=1 Tax=Rhodnius prolixus TaxID=13249 RepID=T1HQB1_RHOPR